MADPSRPPSWKLPRTAAAPRASVAALLVGIAACGGALGDVDGNRYRIAQIGGPTWMAESLRVTRTPAGELWLARTRSPENR